MTCAPCLLAASVWLGSWLRGEAAADDLVDVLAVIAPDAPTAAVPDLLGELRRRHADATWWIAARPGHTLGWPAALAGDPQPSVLVCAGAEPVGLLGLGPDGWTLRPAAGAPVHTLAAEALPVRAATRAFGQLLADATQELERLGLERAPSGPAHRRWSSALTLLPPGLDPRAADLLHRIAGVRDVLEVALADDGAAVTAREAAARNARLRRLGDELEDLAAQVVGGLALTAASGAR